MNWHLIIFDCDGVLVDSEGIANRLIAEALTELGILTSAEEALSEFLGGKLTHIKVGLECKLGITLPEDWVNGIYEKQFVEFKKNLKSIPEIEKVLETIKAAGIPMCVGSNGPPNKMEVSLGVTGLKHYFEGRIFSADHVGIPKPAPDLYLYCAGQMGVKPKNCLVIEDSPRGAKAGVTAGMTVFGYAGTGNEEALAEAGCKEVVSDMKELLELLS
ncbi:MAG: hydrolase [Rhodospirillaceae bacterium]|nr:hydrolase [Rhodospirillaceae bacterium]|tara:strand:+ start:2506 stop:3153 length:648 start_codon:yes stop_codon:yes gene_type:complete